MIGSPKMKRSEMQSVLRECLNYLYGGGTILPDDFSRTSYVLEKLEEAGMLPPPKELDIVTGRILYYYTHDSIESKDILSDYEDKYGDDITGKSKILWEPEDDKN